MEWAVAANLGGTAIFRPLDFSGGVFCVWRVLCDYGLRDPKAYYLSAENKHRLSNAVM